MVARLLSLPIKPWEAGLSDLLARLGRWWLKEFLDLFPDRIAEWLLGRGQKILMLATEQDAVGLKLLSESRRQLASERVSCANYSAVSIDEFLRSHDLERKDVAIGIRLPSEHFFGRRLILPHEAARALEDVVLQDLARKTPFRLEDIYHDCTFARTSGADKILVWQWVIRREFVSDAVAPLAMDLENVAFVDAACATDGRTPPPLIALRRSDRGRGYWLRKMALAVGLGTLVLAVAAGSLKYWHQQSAMDDLERQVATARAKAQQVRSAIDKLEQRQATFVHLRSQKGQTPSLLEVWEEITRVLPAHSWLTELRLSEAPDKQNQQIAMTGFSVAASSLVGLIDQSSWFADTSLTAPIAMDPIEGRERFALQARTKRQDQPKKAP